MTACGNWTKTPARKSSLVGLLRAVAVPPGVGDGGGVLVNVGGKLTMTGGSIVGCSAGGLGGGVHLAYDSSIGKSSTFTMTGGSIIGCAAKNGGGVLIRSGCRFTMGSGSRFAAANA